MMEFDELDRPRTPKHDMEQAISAKTKEEADEIFERMVYGYFARSDKPWTREEAETQVRDNIGYYAGYSDIDTRLRMETLYGAVHPILGPASMNPTPEECFELGLLMGSGSQTTLAELRKAKAELGSKDGKK